MSSHRKNLLITGANGFIGQHLVSALEGNDYSVIAMHRESSMPGGHGGHGKLRYECYSQSEIDSEFYWEQQLEEIDYVIHLAGRAHIVDRSRKNPDAEYYRINTGFTKAISRSAVKKSVKKVIYISTIGVHGRFSRKEPITELSDIRPDTPYAESKYKAELALKDACRDQDVTRYIIFRPPLVYGSNVKGNFLRLMHWINSGLPLPFGMVSNVRSFMHVDNLCNIMIKALSCDDLDNDEYVISDGHDISTQDLIRLMCMYMHTKCKLLPVPKSVLSILAYLVGKHDVVDSLVGDYRIRPQKLCSRISCDPVIGFEDGICESVQWYK